jgi:DNA mismatch repair protein MutS2
MPADRALIPDLLHPTPLRRIDLERTRLALNLAFAGGGSGGLFSEALEGAILARSTFEPQSFASDLFLQRFVSECLKVRIGRHEPVIMAQHLTRLLAHPPADEAIVFHRRAILEELSTSAQARKHFETLYLALCRLRAVLENASGARNWDANRRQLDVLAIFKEIVDCMRSGFADTRSGLSVLAEFGARLQASEPYRSLADLLSYDSRLASLTLNVSVGADGRISGFQVVSLQENAENAFVNPPWRRFLSKVELFLRGYRFSQDEVMARLLDAVFTALVDELVALVQLAGDLEFYLGALGFRDRAHEAGLAVCLPLLVPAQAPRALCGLFNPLLLMSGVKPVPCDLRSSAGATTTLVTGPNSGGKTRLLQSLGLAQLLAQAGLFVPARSAELALCPGMVVSLIEESRADQSEGRLGMELVRIRALFERLPPGAMVLLDELCSGTNPSEGEEIFELVVSMLGRLGPQAFITTHFLTFAARLESEQKIPGLAFLQVELGPHRLPTYQFAAGVARTSLAAHAAERLGVTGEQLLSLIERNLQLRSTTAVVGQG